MYIFLLSVSPSLCLSLATYTHVYIHTLVYLNHRTSGQHHIRSASRLWHTSQSVCSREGDTGCDLDGLRRVKGTTLKLIPMSATMETASFKAVMEAVHRACRRYSSHHAEVLHGPCSGSPSELTVDFPSYLPNNFPTCLCPGR